MKKWSSLDRPDLIAVDLATHVIDLPFDVTPGIEEDAPLPVHTHPYHLTIYFAPASAAAAFMKSTMLRCTALSDEPRCAASAALFWEHQSFA